MRLHLKNVGPEIHGLIVRHKAEHNHKNLDETVECLIRKASKYELDRQLIIKGIKKYAKEPSVLLGWIQGTLNISDEEMKESK